MAVRSIWIKTFGSKHFVREGRNIWRRLVGEARDLNWAQAEAQLHAQPIEQLSDFVVSQHCS